MRLYTPYNAPRLSDEKISLLKSELSNLISLPNKTRKQWFRLLRVQKMIERNEIKPKKPDRTSNVRGRWTDKPDSFKPDALPTAIGGGDGNEV